METGSPRGMLEESAVVSFTGEKEELESRVEKLALLTLAWQGGRDHGRWEDRVHREGQ